MVPGRIDLMRVDTRTTPTSPRRPFVATSQSREDGMEYTPAPGSGDNFAQIGCKRLVGLSYCR